MHKIEPNGLPAFHGDISIRSVNSLPEGLQKKEGKEHVVAHSETGHHHVATGGVYYFDPSNPMVAYLVTKSDVLIEHKRSYDTHETFELLTKGGEVIWEIGRQREHTPDGWRIVED